MADHDSLRRKKKTVQFLLPWGTLAADLRPNAFPLRRDRYRFLYRCSVARPLPDHSILLSLLPVSYQGHPSVELLTKAFRNQIYGAARTSLTHTSLTEKNWFHYAARTWEAIKKSSLMSEFNRLLT